MGGRWWGGTHHNPTSPQNIGKNDKTFPSHSHAVQQQTVFLICQQFAVQSQWTGPQIAMPFPISTVRSRNRCLDRECSADRGCSAQFRLSAVNEQPARWLRDQSVGGGRHVCVCVCLCVILVRRRVVYDRQHSIIPLKSLHQ